VKRWDEEVEKARWLVRELERIEGLRQLGERPKRHTLATFESPSFHRVAKEHKRRGFFLYEELRRRRIAGIHPGMTKLITLNTYGLSMDQLRRVADAFHEIARSYNIEVG
jgi:Sep-tRNA:Cys-tRNA synthetase